MWNTTPGERREENCTNRVTNDLSFVPNCWASGRWLKTETQVGRREQILPLLSERGSRRLLAAVGVRQVRAKGAGELLVVTYATPFPDAAHTRLPVPAALGEGNLPSFLPSLIWRLAVRSIFETVIPMSCVCAPRGAAHIMAGILKDMFPSPERLSSREKSTQLSEKGSATLTATLSRKYYLFFK